MTTHLCLPTLELLDKYPVEINKLAASLYPDLTFDCALPQQWVDACASRGIDLRGQVVWGYPKGVCSQPYPLTAEAAIKLAQLAGQIWL